MINAGKQAANGVKVSPPLTIQDSDYYYIHNNWRFPGWK
jgi:hypothetical protein